MKFFPTLFVLIGRKTAEATENKRPYSPPCCRYFLWADLSKKASAATILQKKLTNFYYISFLEVESIDLSSCKKIKNE